MRIRRLTVFGNKMKTNESLIWFFDPVLDTEILPRSAETLLNAIGVDYFDVIFFRGVLLALLGRFESALELFRSVVGQVSRAKIYNNCGVCYANLGDRFTEGTCFQGALNIMPSYLDAQINIAHRSAFRLTRFPLRRISGRSYFGK